MIPMDTIYRNDCQGIILLSLSLSNILLFFYGFNSLLLVESSVYKEPSFYEQPICLKKDPHLVACIRNQMENVKNRLKYGMPYIEVPSMDPLDIPLINLTEDEDKFLLKLFNVEVTGFSNFVVDDLRLDVNQLKMDIKCHAPRISFEGTYQVRGPVFRVNLNSTGNLNLTFWHVPFRINIVGELYEKNDRQVYLEIVKLNNTLELPKKAFITFDNVFNGDAQRESIIQKMVDDNWKSIFDMYKSVPEVGLTELFKNITNKVFSRTPYKMFMG